jgi:hypothetical protein
MTRRAAPPDALAQFDAAMGPATKARQPPSQRLNVHATLAKPAVVNRLRALRGPGESYSDVILQAAGLFVTGPRARRRGPAA